MWFKFYGMVFRVEIWTKSRIEVNAYILYLMATGIIVINGTTVSWQQHSIQWMNDGINLYLPRDPYQY